MDGKANVLDSSHPGKAVGNKGGLGNPREGGWGAGEETPAPSPWCTNTQWCDTRNLTEIHNDTRIFTVALFMTVKRLVTTQMSIRNRLVKSRWYSLQMESHTLHGSTGTTVLYG